MEGKIRKIFPGANTANGSFNFFDNIIQGDINRIFCFKGGPGVGKSSLMKKIAQEFIDRGYDVELHHCPSDPSSLDALLIKKLGVVLLDGTSPHIVDPKNPGAVDEIVNLGEFWNVENLEKNKDEIIKVGKDISASFRRAYKFLKAAEPIYFDIEEKYSNSMNFGKVNLLVDEFIEKIEKLQEIGVDVSKIFKRDTILKLVGKTIEESEEILEDSADSYDFSSTTVCCDCI